MSKVKRLFDEVQAMYFDGYYPEVIACCLHISLDQVKAAIEMIEEDE